MIYSDNEIYNTSAATAAVYGFEPSASSINGFSFISNYIHDLTGSSGDVPSGCGIYLNSVAPSTTCLIANNRIVLNPDTLNNTLFGIYDNPASPALPFEIVYNTIVISGSSSTGGNANSAAYTRGVNSSTKLFNNILENSRISTGGYQAVVFLMGSGGISTLITNLTSDYNDLYVPTATSYSNIVYHSGTLLPLSSWQTYSKDAHSLNVKPAFVNPYTDLHIQGTNCMLNGKGTPITTSAGFAVAVTEDFDNDVRNDSFPDMGADEFTGISLQPPTLTLSDDTIYSTSASFYQWYLNGMIITGATDSFYVIAGDGTYNVLISDSNGCSSFGNEMLITFSNDLMKDVVKVYPNPAKDQFTVYCLQFTVGDSLDIYNTLGEKIYSSVFNGKQKTVNSKQFTSGIYFLSVHTDKGILSKKIIIEK